MADANGEVPTTTEVRISYTYRYKLWKMLMISIKQSLKLLKC